VSNATLIVDVDPTSAQARLALLQSQVDDVMREEKKAREAIKRTVATGLRTISSLYSAIRMVTNAAGVIIDKQFDSFMQILQGAISVALTTKLIAEAQVFIGNPLAIISIFMASFAIGQSVRGMIELERQRKGTLQIQRDIANLSNVARERQQILSGLGGF
jgi:uncharacterized protein (DUF2062 family)